MWATSSFVTSKQNGRKAIESHRINVPKLVVGQSIVENISAHVAEWKKMVQNAAGAFDEQSMK